MNKYQEALDFITDHTHPMCETMKDLEALDFSYNILQELVDKETPVKPVYRIPDISWNKNEKLAHCPTCDWRLDWEQGCHNNKCRQKIDWSDGE